MMKYPKRLIEVDLPIKRISAHSRREKSIRHGHISTLHIWWARRPLAACRAVICAALWPDPADELCPVAFCDKARTEMQKWTTHDHQAMLSAESRNRFERARQNLALFKDTVQLRGALLDFIADFANWDNSTIKEFLDTSRWLTQAAHEALGGAPDTRPLVVDPFAGGGSIPLEALRVGADAFASDLNPVAVLLNKVVLEYIPKYGQRLADEVRKWGGRIKKEAERELAEFYPKDPDGATPIAYLWARTIICEGPGCGAEVPLIRNLIIAKRNGKTISFKLVPNQDEPKINIEIIQTSNSTGIDKGTLSRGSVTCPVCGYTTPVKSVRSQLKVTHGGVNNARLLAIVVEEKNGHHRFYRLPLKMDLMAVVKAKEELSRRQEKNEYNLIVCPNEELPLMSGVFNVPLYGHSTWGSLFTMRQALLLTTLSRLVRDIPIRFVNEKFQIPIEVLQSLLALAVDRQADYASSICTWVSSGEFIGHTFAQGQSLPIKFDFVEGAPFANGSGNWDGAIDWIARVCESCATARYEPGTTTLASATCHPLPDDSASLLATDPPYYNAVPYADLSDFFYVWLKQILGSTHKDLFREKVAPKNDEICEMAGWDPVRYPHKNKTFFEANMAKALAEGWRLVAPSGLGIVVFAHKETSGWEAILQAMVNSGWIITGSWPIDTEMGARLRARNSATLASSIHLICRPRTPGAESAIGDWRDVLAELPRRIHEWMPRLSAEGIVGADAIFACLGPALEVFSRYSCVEKASGEEVTLKEYLEYVWAAVAKEALNMVFEGADATGFEEDARLTAMWLWTLSSGNNGNGKRKSSKEDDEIDDEDDSEKAKKSIGGYALEYDAARKIAQGLGAHLEKLSTVIEVKGDTAHLLPVSERTRFLFGKDETQSPSPKRKKKEPQLKLSFMKEIEEIETKDGWGTKSSPRAGSTVLDRLHQGMILFAAGRSEALKRFLVEEGAGNDQRFWRLAQALSALYPKSSDEKRWVDGVLARKKGLGF